MLIIIQYGFCFHGFYSPVDEMLIHYTNLCKMETDHNRYSVIMNQLTREYLPKWNKNPCFHKTCTSWFIVPLFIITKDWTEPRCSSTGEEMNKLWYSHTVEYYSEMKRNKLQMTHSHVGESQMHCAKQKSDLKVYIYCDFIYMTLWPSRYWLQGWKTDQ